MHHSGAPAPPPNPNAQHHGRTPACSVCDGGRRRRLGGLLRSGPQGADRLTLVRTPHLEFMLRPEQRGVSVGAQAGQRPALIVAVQWGHKCVDVVSTAKRYSLDISKVDNATRNAALRVLGKMNFDQRFQLVDGYP